jgi:DNA-binding NarL/FixJ family response regulator
MPANPLAVKTGTPLTVAVIHGHEVVRKGLRAMVEQEGTAKVVLEVGELSGLAAAMPKEGVQVALFHTGGSASQLQDAVKWMRKRHPATGVLVMGELTPALAERFVQAEAHALLHGSAPGAELRKAMAISAKGGLYGNSWMRDPLRKGVRGRQEDRPKVKLPRMQRKVAVMLRNKRCFTRKMIAERLGIGKRTVDSYIEALFRKFKVRSRQALLVKLDEGGWS